MEGPPGHRVPLRSQPFPVRASNAGRQFQDEAAGPGISMRTIPLLAALLLQAGSFGPTAALAQSTEAPYLHTLSVRDAEAGALSRMVHPEFPVKAARQGIEKGYVEARLHVDDDGEVISIDVTRSYPTGAFDRAATGALKQWRFKKGAVGKTVDVSIEFFRATP